MTFEEIVQELQNLPNAALINREKLCQKILKHHQAINTLVQLTFEVDNKLSIRAAWILEMVCKSNLNLIIPYLDPFCNNINKLVFDSSKRACAKICELLALEYNRNPRFRNSITNTHREHIISTCFDWLLSDQKIAVEAYSMMVLYIFGKEIQWIHPELKSIIIEHMANKSCGYKARGKKLIKLMS